MSWTRRRFGQLSLAGATSLGIFGPGGLVRAPAGASETTSSHGVSAFGDLKYAAGFEKFDYAVAGAPKGGTYSFGFGGITFDSTNAYVIKGNPALGMSVTTDTLMTSAADEADAMYGLLAESIEYPADRAWAAFTLRPEARFRDGAPVTPEDVVFSFDVLREKGHPSYRITFAGVERAVVDGPGRVRFDFRPEAAKRDLPMVVAGIPIFQKAWFDDPSRDFGEATLEPFMTSGPYEVEVDRVEPGRTISFRRREDYWARDLPVNKGRWNFDRIRIEYFLDRSAAFEAFKAGAYTFNEEFWSKMWATAYEPSQFPAVGRGEVLLDTLPDNRPSGTQGFWFNLRRPQFQDVRVREAIAVVFDFEWSNKTLFYDLYTRTDSFFEGGPMEAAGKPSPQELAILEPLADQLPPGLFDDAAYVPPETDGSGRNRRQLRAAGRLLDDAGWKIENGIRKKDGKPLTIEFLLSSPSFERIVVPYVKLLERVGIEATSRRVDAAQYKRRTDEYDFDVTVDRKGMSLTPGVELREYFHSDSANSPGSDNLAGLANPAVDRLVETIERAESREELATAVKALDRVLRALHIWVPQWAKASHHIAYWDIYGRPPAEQKPAYARGVIDLWWVDQAKAARFGDKFSG